MISRSRCVPTSLTSLPFSRSGKARAEPICPDPMMVTVFMARYPFPVSPDEADVYLT